MFLVFYALFAIAVLAACTYDEEPSKGIVDFICDDPLLEKLILDCAQEWTDAGLVVASRVTVNVNPKGMPIEWTSPEEMFERCRRDPKDYEGKGVISGCTTFDNGKFETLWIANDSSPERLRVVMMHELIHIIVPTQLHLKDDEVGILSLHGNSDQITSADLAFLGKFTQVV